MDIDWAPVLADLFLYSYDVDFKERKEAINDVRSVNNCKLCDLVDHIFPIDLEINDTTDTTKSVSDEIYSKGRLRTRITKRNAWIMLFAFIY
jgi:hypothetical protein